MSSGITSELTRPGAITPEVRALLARGQRLLCEREHPAALAAGRIAEGVPCCPFCTVVTAVAG